MSGLKYPKCHDCVFTDCHKTGRIKLYPRCFLKLSNEPRPVVETFAEEMEKQLRANGHKGGWENSTYDWLSHGLRDNLAALSTILNQEPRGLIQQEEIMRRSANIANFAMMIADNARRFMVQNEEA